MSSRIGQKEKGKEKENKSWHKVFRDLLLLLLFSSVVNLPFSFPLSLSTTKTAFSTAAASSLLKRDTPFPHSFIISPIDTDRRCLLLLG